MSSAVWSELAALAKAPLNLRQEFAGDPQRAERFTAKALGITLDYSKNLITQGIWPATAPVGRAKSITGQTRRDVCRRQN